MTTIVLNVENDQKATLLLTFLRDLDYVAVKTEPSETVGRSDDNREVEQAESGIKFGFLKGIIPDLPDSFFDPLPEDELQAWEGKYSTWDI